VTGGDDTLRSMQDQLARSAREARHRLYGVYRGTVVAVGTKSSDQKNEGLLGQLQVSVPEIWGSNTTDLPWANPVVPFAGDGYGALLLPKEKDGVCLLFEGGNQDHPVWIGGFWSHNAKRPDPGAADVRVVVSPNGHKVIIDDKNDKLQLAHSSGNKITITKDEITIEVDSGGKIVVDKSSVTINGTALSVDK
jgi:uncharacterized protein involved in type VI secretion and phage assembly